MQLHRQASEAREADCNEEVLASLANESPVHGLPGFVPPTSQPGKAELPAQEPPLPELQSHLSQVDKLEIGTWLGFQMEGNEILYCTLAVRLHSVDRLVFVNNKGVKVLEKTREGLARELQQGSVRIVSEWPLFERGMESVIARLRERQQG